MSHPDLIVVGASAGGVEALQKLVAGLPPEFPAAMLVVLHLPSSHLSALPAILSRSGALSAVHPTSGQPIERGIIYVAPPDVHLLVNDGQVDLWRGPRENRVRPSIDPLFRSAAEQYRDRLIGVILTGTLDDGSAGLWWVKKFGGIAIVQDPHEAAFKDMPENALGNVQADYVAPVAKISRLLVELTQGNRMQPVLEESPEWKPKNS